MREERINFGAILKIGISLLPVLIGLNTLSLIICAYNIAFSFIVSGPVTCLISSLAAVCLSMLYGGMFGAAGQLQGLFLGIEAVFCALACVYAILRKRSFYTGVWLAAAGYLVPSFIDLYVLAGKAGQSIASFLTAEQLGYMRGQLNYVLQQAGLDLGAIDNNLNAFDKIVVMSVPSILIITSILMAYIIMWLICAPLRKTPLRVEHSFAKITLPKAVPSVLAVAFAASVFMRSNNILYMSIAFNTAVILGSLCFFAGMSVVDYYMRRIVKSVFLRMVIHFIAIIMSAVLIIGSICNVYMVLGAVSSFINLRKPFSDDIDMYGNSDSEEHFGYTDKAE